MRFPLKSTLTIKNSTSFPGVVPDSSESGVLRMRNEVVKEGILLEPSYRNKIGKVTFVVSAYGNPNGKETAKDMLLHLMEERVTEEVRKRNQLKEEAS